MRLFFALSPDPESRRRIDRLLALAQPALACCGRLTPSENLHVTLQFVGEWPQAELSTLTTLLDDVATSHRPFTLTLDRFGVFGGGRGRERRDRRGGRSGEGQQILWLGDSVLHSAGRGSSCADPDRSELLDIVQALRQGAAALGIEPDARPYFPHITLTRKLPVNQTDAVLEALPAFAPIRIPVGTLTLMESVPEPGGMAYRTVRDAALGPMG